MRPEPAYRVEARRAGARAASPATCRECGSPVLAGLDADSCAVRVEVDHVPLSTEGEARCVLAARPTFEAWPARDRVELERRTIGKRLVRPIGARGVPAVLPAHRCGSPAPCPAPDPPIKERLPDEPEF